LGLKKQDDEKQKERVRISGTNTQKYNPDENVEIRHYKRVSYTNKDGKEKSKWMRVDSIKNPDTGESEYTNEREADADDYAHINRDEGYAKLEQWYGLKTMDMKLLQDKGLDAVLENEGKAIYEGEHGGSEGWERTKNIGKSALTSFAYSFGFKIVRKVAKPIFKTTKEATIAAKKMGYQKTNVNWASKNQTVYKKGNKYISRDATGHKGGAWKVFDKKGNRVGTYNSDLTNKVDK